MKFLLIIAGIVFLFGLIGWLIEIFTAILDGLSNSINKGNKTLKSKISTILSNKTKQTLTLIKNRVFLFFKYGIWTFIALFIGYAFAINTNIFYGIISSLFIFIPLIFFKTDEETRNFCLDKENSIFVIKKLNLDSLFQNFINDYEKKQKDEARRKKLIEIEAKKIEAEELKEKKRKEEEELKEKRKIEEEELEKKRWKEQTEIEMASINEVINTDLKKLTPNYLRSIFNEYQKKLIQYQSYLEKFDYKIKFYENKLVELDIEPKKEFVNYSSAILDNKELDHELFILPTEFKYVSKDVLFLSSVQKEADDIAPPPQPPEFDNFFSKINRYYDLSQNYDGRSYALDDSINTYVQLFQDYKNCKNYFNYRYADFNNIKNNFDLFKKHLFTLANKAKNAEKSKKWDDVKSLLKMVDISHYLPEKMRTTDVEYEFDEESRILLISYEFPNYEDDKFYLKGSSRIISEKLKADFLKASLLSIAIRYGHLAAYFNYSKIYDSVAVNITNRWTDRATGKIKNGVIASFFMKTEDLIDLNLERIDSEVAFKKFKGIATPTVDQNIAPLKPIYEVNKNDKRIVPTQNVSEKIDEDANLASMDWEEFESLVAQLFEWEFAEQGNEVKVTQASRDKGIDAIMFDPDPIKGGKYVLQAKRYTNVVDVSAVRDLYGTMLNEGANKGIIITTSSYGKDAYEFAKDKPLSLVDGSHLLNMLQKHGKKYKINLDEARRINKQKDILKRKKNK